MEKRDPKKLSKSELHKLQGDTLFKAKVNFINLLFNNIIRI